jgi:hypothetical protein
MSSFVEAQRGVSKLISIGRYGVLDAIWQDPSRLAAENSRSLERTNPSPSRENVLQWRLRFVRT